MGAPVGGGISGREMMMMNFTVCRVPGVTHKTISLSYRSNLGNLESNYYRKAKVWGR